MIHDRSITGPESNTSRISRVSLKYGIPPTAFVQHYLNDGKALNREFFQFEVATCLNSCTPKTKRLERQLNILLGVDSDKCNSYSFLEDVVDSKAHGLISKQRKWCHLCYQERRDKRRPFDNSNAIFDDLYWSMDRINICMLHAVKLSSSCTWCKKSQPYISTTVEIGHCHYCHAFLGNSNTISINEQEWLQLREVFTLFYANTYSEYRPRKAQLVKNLKALRSIFPSATSRYLGDAMGVSEDIVRKWISGSRKPQLDTLFLLQKALGLFGPHQLFYDTQVFLKKVALNGRIALKLNKKSEYNSLMLESRISKFLNGVIAGQHEPISRTKIAQRFGVSESYLQRRFSGLCQRVSDALSEHRFTIRSQQVLRIEYQMEQAVSTLISKDRTITLENALNYFTQKEIIKNFQDYELLVFLQKAIDTQKAKRKKNRSKNIR